MGERLVIQFTDQDNPKIQEVAIYQHWSGYTASALETNSNIFNWIENFQDSELFKTLTPDDRFVEFARALGSNEIISNAYLKDTSVATINSFIKEPIIYDVNRLNRNDGLVGVNAEAQDLMSWAELSIYYMDASSWFSDTPEPPQTDARDFYNFEEFHICATNSASDHITDFTALDCLDLMRLEKSKDIVTNLDQLDYYSDNYSLIFEPQDATPFDDSKTLYEFLKEDLFITPLISHSETAIVRDLNLNLDGDQSFIIIENGYTDKHFKMTLFEIYTPIA